MEVEILRLNHRIGRDPRISTHVALTARAFGASKIYYSGQKDSNMEDVVNKITANFGGPFTIKYENECLKLIKEKKKSGFIIVHLTVYGLNLLKEIKKIRTFKKLLIIIGGEKVEQEFYKTADYNLSVTNQPHSEVAALAIVLHEFFQGREFDKKFNDFKINIVPDKANKVAKSKRENF